jgi:U3 small nucleolar ribonucleoprotein component
MSALGGGVGGVGEEAQLSNYEKQQLKIQGQIDQLEEFNATDKPWQLKGEVQGGARPLDSLLQEDLDFEVMTKPAPDITEESTVTLEDMIKQRIKDEAFDDVERKEDPKNVDAYVPKSFTELDTEKSKQGLAEIYEDEFQRQARASFCCFSFSVIFAVAARGRRLWVPFERTVPSFILGGGAGGGGSNRMLPLVMHANGS